MDTTTATHTLPLLTWAALLGPMPAVLLLAAVTYYLSRHGDGDDGS